MDFHIHGNYSRATSESMVFEEISRQAELKGLDVVGSGDILYSRWREELENELEKVSEGTFVHPEFGTRFIPTVEVEDENDVHHLILVPSLDKSEELREKFRPHSSDLNIDGRPSLQLDAPSIVEYSIDSGCSIGPSHAFTPWTSIFKEFDTLEECYGDMANKVDFLELGLSADTYMADRIKEIRSLNFLSNSDAHSPWPNRLGREFNILKLSNPVAEDILDAIRRKRRIKRNVGLSPQMGKYHLTACSNCYSKYSLSEAISHNWECEECGADVKKGVSDRVDEISDFEEPRHPDFRPNYLHIVPLSEIIALSKDISDPWSKDVQNKLNSLLDFFSDEISVLVEEPISDIEQHSDSKVASMIEKFRRDDLEIVPGGGGAYGELKDKSKIIKTRNKETQKRLTEFGD